LEVTRVKQSSTEIEPQPQSYPLTPKSSFILTRWLAVWRGQTMLVGLMMPLMMMVINGAMFGVALPTIRADFNLEADTAAWLLTAYTLPFMMVMPLYGRLSDGLGKRRLFLAGIIIFLVGTAIALLAVNMSLVVLGRAIQGIGAAGVNPLSMAIISECFPPRERGQALGTWNSTGPLGGLLGPILGGFFIDLWGWRAVFWPTLLVGLITLWASWKYVPSLPRRFIQPGFLRTFDWVGAILLSLTVTMLVFYVSSRPITGIESLRDGRLLAATILFLGAFIVWEKRCVSPFVALSIFANLDFSRASFGSSLRMFIMSGIGFLLPLYLTDIYALSATTVGLVMMLHGGALLMTMRLGGQLADRWGSRPPVMIGSVAQLTMVIYFALLPSSSLGLVMVGLMAHGLGAGMSLAALHRFALNKIPPEQTGLAAGLYGMIRSAGVVMGGVAGGVILQYGLEQLALPLNAYRLGFGFMAGVALLGVVVAWGLRE
jgi:EmrB/QacA subfamily drug resistance transporter